MATIGQIYYNVLDNNSGSYISSHANLDIFSDIVATYGAKQFNKLGIQAPPGTKVVMNSTKTIMIGRTGMYELDDDIAILNMYFIKPKKYVYREEASQQLKEEGTAEMLAADEARKEAMANLELEYPDGIPSEEEDPAGYKTYWDKYNEIQSTYTTAYEAGWNKYNQGVNGVYTLPNENDVNAEENYQDLFNIIVDFIYE